ncbi:MAG: hypothetical protein CMI63_14300 [Parvularcula sp.]|jgi:uncharacterized membrane protein YccC|nr:hypothetical protein [Parvularcula sp.]
MLDVILDSMKLFLTGRLFQDYDKVARQFFIGALCGALLAVVVGYFTTPLVGAIVGGAVAGFLQPYLFKDLKYR